MERNNSIDRHHHQHPLRTSESNADHTSNERDDGSKENLSSYENIFSKNSSQLDKRCEGIARPANGHLPSLPSSSSLSLDDDGRRCRVRSSSSLSSSSKKKKKKEKEKTATFLKIKEDRNLLSPSNEVNDSNASSGTSKGCGAACRRSEAEAKEKEEEEEEAVVMGPQMAVASLEENLNSLDQTIKRCHLRLDKKLKRESDHFVPYTSLAKISSCKSTNRTEKVIVFMRVVFLKIGEIDTMKENFAADAFIQARWREPALDGMIFQDLTLTITTERSESELELEEDTDEISSINVQSFVDEQEWKLHSHVETWKKITTKAYQNSKAKHPSFSTSCRATRRPGFFIWNIFLVMLFICSLTFATFCVDLMKPENRLQLSFILLLTTITFKFVVSQTLPRISYLTYLDKYILISMAILCGVCVWHALVFSFLRHDLELAKTIDRWALIISGSSYFLFHVFFFSTIYLVALKKRWKYDKKDKEHKERIKRLQRLQELAKINIPPQESRK